MPASFGYILNTRPFRDTSYLVDIFSEDHGRICCIARPAKKRGKIVKGNLQPFRYHHLQWIGKGEVQTLTEVDERGRHSIPAAELMLGIYLNELLLLLTRQHVPMPELFSAYKYTLHKLVDPLINQQILMRFEMYLLAHLGYPLEIQAEAEILPEMRYRLTQDNGLISSSNEEISSALHQQTITGELLLALEDLAAMEASHWKQLREYLDATLQSLAPRPLNARKLLSL